MNRELLLLVDALSREKNVQKEVVFGAVEAALARASEKRFKENADVRVEIDRDTGDYKSWRRWQVVDHPVIHTETPSRYECIAIESWLGLNATRVASRIPVSNCVYGAVASRLHSPQRPSCERVKITWPSELNSTRVSLH